MIIATFQTEERDWEMTNGTGKVAQWEFEP